MTPEDFSFLARLLRRRSGLWLTPAKTELVERRLLPAMRRFGFRDMDGLVRELRLGHETLARAVAEAVTVNETSFFRDPAFFLRFQTVLLPQMLRARESEKRLRIWSAASAAGQEAYCIAMSLAAAGLAEQGWSIDLIATDLSSEAVARAQSGRYDEMEMSRGLGDEMRARWFHKDGKDWRVAESLRRMVDFRVFNLLDSFGWLADLDFVFCRNVLIYFDPGAKRSVLERIADTLRPDGMLVLGETEAPEPFVQTFVEAPGGEGVFLRNHASVARLAAY